MKRQLENSEIRIRNFSEPLESQKETTSYGERVFFTADLTTDLTLQVRDLLKLEKERIKIWRAMSRNSYIDFAIDDIINEMIANDDTDVFPVDIDLGQCTAFTDNIKTKIHDEFISLQKKLQFHKKAYGLLKDWFIDGRSYFFIKFDAAQKNILEVIPLDPIRTSRITYDDEKKTVEYIYQDYELSNIIYTIPENQMIEISSGIMDENHQIWVSYLEKAYVPLNQLSSIEDALVIYRLSRAPERRVFYIDVGELPKTKAEAYMRDVINNFRNKMEYDSKTGCVKEKGQHLSLLDDLYLPRRGSGNGTSVDTLQGGMNLGQMEDVDYFLKKLFRSLNIPFSRWGGEDTAANVIGRTTEISRDEIKYSHFISRLRTQYNTLFYILLKSSLNLKKIVTAEEFDEQRDNIIFQWNADNMFNTFKNFDLLLERYEILEKVMPWTGKLISLDWVRREILGFNDEDIIKMKKQMDKEKPEQEKIDKTEEDAEEFGR